MPDQQAVQTALAALRDELQQQHTAALQQQEQRHTAAMQQEQQRFAASRDALKQDLAAAVDTAEAMRLVVTQLTKQASQNRIGT